MRIVQWEDVAPRERELVLGKDAQGEEFGIVIRSIDMADVVAHNVALPAPSPGLQGDDLTREQMIATAEANRLAVARAGVVRGIAFDESENGIRWSTLTLQLKRRIAEAILDISGVDDGEDAKRAEAFRKGDGPA